MVAISGLTATVASAAPVDYTCDLSRDGQTKQLRFDIDLASFAPPVDKSDPPRRRVSTIRHGTDRFEAEAILMASGDRGFWSQERGWLLTVTETGTARLSDAAPDAWVGQCKEID